MTGTVLGLGDPPQGRTVIAARALRAISLSLAAEAAGVGRHRVRTELADSGGALTVSVTLPVVLAAGSSILPASRQAAILRERLLTGMAGLAGRRVDAVNVRFDGALRRDRGSRDSGRVR